MTRHRDIVRVVKVEPTLVQCIIPGYSPRALVSLPSYLFPSSVKQGDRFIGWVSGGEEGEELPIVESLELAPEVEE